MPQSTATDEAEAIRRTLRGDPDSFRPLMHQHYPTAYRLAFRITGNAEDAEEAAQEAFFRAYRKLDTFQLHSSFSTWVNRIAMNTALNLVERRSRDASHAALAKGNQAAASESYLQPRPMASATEPPQLQLPRGDKALLSGGEVWTAVSRWLQAVEGLSK